MSAPGEVLLELDNGSVRYPGSAIEAVSGVSLQLRRGEILGLVGESGSGKSTTARAMLGLVPLSGGRLLLRGEPIGPNSVGLRETVQAIFQNPAASFNPKRLLLDSVAEPLRVRRQGDAAARQRRTIEELDRVGIAEAVARRYPLEVSGGQCQRAAIARATIVRPEVLVCDEPVSALDVSIQAQILELLAALRAEQGLAMLFISHDLGVVASLCDRTAVMYAGRIVEEGSALQLAHDPRHPYSVMLHDSAPTWGSLAPQRPRLAAAEPGETVAGHNVTTGCRFEPSCPLALPRCRDVDPQLRPLSPGHSVACHNPFDPTMPEVTASPESRR
jgi:oligopeptide/dipeptide ABC transporter ATP-binding protein